MVLLNKGGVTCHFFLRRDISHEKVGSFLIFSNLIQYLGLKSGNAALFSVLRARERKEEVKSCKRRSFFHGALLFFSYGVLFYFFPVLTTRSRVLPERASVSLSSILVRSQLLKRATKRINNFQKFLKKKPACGAP